MTFNKSDLIDKLVTSANVPKKKAEDIINLIFDGMTAALTREERIEIRGFGSFIAKRRRARTGRNPRTGASIPVVAKRMPFFKVGKELRERVDQGRLKHPQPGAANGPPASEPSS